MCVVIVYNHSETPVSGVCSFIFLTYRNILRIHFKDTQTPESIFNKMKTLPDVWV